MLKTTTITNIQKRLDQIDQEVKNKYNGQITDNLKKEKELLTGVINDEKLARGYETLLNYYNKFINKKNAKDVDPEDWEFYKDYHAEIFGFEPTFLKFGQ